MIDSVQPRMKACFRRMPNEKSSLEASERK